MEKQSSFEKKKYFIKEIMHKNGEEMTNIPSF
jgi:hypothetical protein